LASKLVEQASEGDIKTAGLPAGWPAKRLTMLANFDEMQKFGKDNVEATLRSLGAASKGFQALAAEVTNYSKKSFEDGTAAVERLMAAKTLEKAIEVQAEYAKSAYEGFVAQATKIGELYANIAKESYKPFEGYLAKVTPSK
jgi:phasin family protein